jgi:hypothetical protein
MLLQLKRKKRRGEKRLKQPLLPACKPSWNQRKVKEREKGRENKANEENIFDI